MVPGGEAGRAAADGGYAEGMTDLQKHAAFFDGNGDGIVSISETYDGELLPSPTRSFVVILVSNRVLTFGRCGSVSGPGIRSWHVQRQCRLHQWRPCKQDQACKIPPTLPTLSVCVDSATTTLPLLFRSTC
jgi:hypothetical protein